VGDMHARDVMRSENSLRVREPARTVSSPERGSFLFSNTAASAWSFTRNLAPRARLPSRPRHAIGAAGVAVVPARGRSSELSRSTSAAPWSPARSPRHRLIGGRPRPDRRASSRTPQVWSHASRGETLLALAPPRSATSPTAPRATRARASSEVRMRYVRARTARR